MSRKEEQPLKIHGTLDDVLKAAFTPQTGKVVKPKPKAKKAKK